MFCQAFHLKIERYSKSEDKLVVPRLDESPQVHVYMSMKKTRYRVKLYYSAMLKYQYLKATLFSSIGNKDLVTSKKIDKYDLYCSMAKIIF